MVLIAIQVFRSENSQKGADNMSHCSKCQGQAPVLSLDCSGCVSKCSDLAPLELAVTGFTPSFRVLLPLCLARALLFMGWSEILCGLDGLNMDLSVVQK